MDQLTESNDLRSSTARPLREHYDAKSFSTLGLLWRRKGLIAATCILGGLIAAFGATALGERYTAEVVVEPKLARDQSRSTTGVSLDAASLIETEVELIRSRGVAQKVVSRLDLKNDPIFGTRNIEGTLDANSTATAVLRNIRVSNDARSYLIKISFTSISPIRAAQIANAFAEEYLRARREAAARRELSEISAMYGPQHPALRRAQAALDEAVRFVPTDAILPSRSRIEPFLIVPFVTVRIVAFVIKTSGGVGLM